MVDVSAKAGVPHITPHSTSSKITERGSAWIFRVPISSRFYKSVDAEYLAKNTGLRIAYIISADSASLTQGTQLKDQIKKHRNWNSQEIVIGPKPYNIGESKMYTYDYYM